jgi:hypothetical protein
VRLGSLGVEVDVICKAGGQWWEEKASVEAEVA